MVYARFLTFITATLSFQRVAGEDICNEELNELVSNPKYIEYDQAVVQESMACSTDESKCGFSDLEQMCTDMNAVFYVLTMTTTCDGIPAETKFPQCYPECVPIDDVEQTIKDSLPKTPDQPCTIDIDIDGGTSDGVPYAAPSDGGTGVPSATPSDSNTTAAPSDGGTAVPSATPSDGNTTVAPSDGGTSAASNFSLNTIAVVTFGMLLHSLAEAMI